MRRRVVLLLSLLNVGLLGCGTTSGQDVPQDSGAPDDTGDQDGIANDGGAGPTDKVRLVVEPDDKAAAVTDAIRNAKTSVHLEQYLLTDTSAQNALIAAKAAGKEVKVLLEKSPYPDVTANNAAYGKLQTAGVDVKWTNGTFTLTHSKFFVIDGVEAWITTLNFTNSGLAGNREYAAVDDDPTDVAEAEAIFTADFTAAGSTPAGPLVVSPTTSRTSIRALLNAATSTIDMEMEELSDDEMVQRLGNAAAKGIAVRIVVPGSGRSADMNTSITTMQGRGVQVKALSSPDVHAKVIVVDGATLYVGSVNLTTASLDHNREVGVLTVNADAIGRAKSTIDKDFAAGISP